MTRLPAQFVRGVTIGLAVACGLAATACQGTTGSAASPANTPTAPAIGTSTIWTPVVTSVPTAPTNDPQAGRPAPIAAPNLTFPNSSPYVAVLGYDPTTRLITFRVVDRYTSATTQDHFDYRPSDPAVHRLPVASTATIYASGLGVICPSRANSRVPLCTTQELSDAVTKRGDEPFAVQLVVNSSDVVITIADQDSVLIG